MSDDVIPDAALALNTGSLSLVKYPAVAWLPQLYAVFQSVMSDDVIPDSALAPFS